MKKQLHNKISSPANFYDKISGFYDKMIDFDKNLTLRIGAYSNIFPQSGEIIDIGCGVGLDSIALSKIGHHVTAFDISPQMVMESRRNALKYGVGFSVYEGSFSSIPSSYRLRFDYLISVGNTIAHLNSAELKEAVRKMFRLLKPGGKALIHILNYERILKEKKRINNIAVRDGKTIIRFYDLNAEKIIFNILSFPTENPKEYRLVTTHHFPHKRKDILFNLRSSGFNKVKFSGDFKGSVFDPINSKDIFISAVK